MPSILILDDEPHVGSALKRILQGPLADRAGIEVFTDPHAALGRVQVHAFDVVISDFRMPLLDGVQFLLFVRELQPHAVRMIVSASTEAATVMNAINVVGVFRYIAKPWESAVLIQDVHDALDQAVASREQRYLANSMRVRNGTLDINDAESRLLEELEPGITQVMWGPGGEVLLPLIHSDPT